MGQNEASLDSYTAAERYLCEIVRRQPRDIFATFGAAGVLQDLAKLQEKMGRPSSAVVSYEESMRIENDLFKRLPSFNFNPDSLKKLKAHVDGIRQETERRADGGNRNSPAK